MRPFKHTVYRSKAARLTPMRWRLPAACSNCKGRTRTLSARNGHTILVPTSACSCRTGTATCLRREARVVAPLNRVANCEAAKGGDRLQNALALIGEVAEVVQVGIR